MTATTAGEVVVVVDDDDDDVVSEDILDDYKHLDPMELALAAAPR
jgi:hypothetical protein